MFPPFVDMGVNDLDHGTIPTATAGLYRSTHHLESYPLLKLKQKLCFSIESVYILKWNFCLYVNVK